MNDYERNADVSKTLNDKWKKGELPEGWYYVKGNRAEGIYAYTAEYLNNMYRPRNGEKIIEQVPSYEQWIMTKNLSERAHLEMYKARGEKVRLEKENTKLKELLKECSELMDNTKVINIDVYMQRKKDVLNSINQVLGEE